MGKIELRYGQTHSGKNKRKLIKETTNGLLDLLKRMDENPRDYEEKDLNSKFRISVELVKINN